MRRILATGGAGFVGSSLAQRLVEDPENYVVAIDDLSTGRVENLPAPRSNFRFIKTDVNDYSDVSAVMLSCRFDYVFHYAACVGVQRTLQNPGRVLADIDGIKNVLGLAKNTGVRRVFYSSSSEVYGEPVEFPQNEDTTPVNSKLPYAVIKNVGEAFLRSYEREYGLSYTIFRFFNTYGPKQSTDFVMTRFIEAALHDRDIPVYGDGSQSRTFCYIEDNVDATINALVNETCVNDVINIGNDAEVSILQLAQAIIEITGSRSRVVHLPPLKEGDMKRRQPDITKMRQVLGRELTPLSEGIRRVVAQKATCVERTAPAAAAAASTASYAWS